MKQKQVAELFLTGPISNVEDQNVSIFDPLKKEIVERTLLNTQRNRSLLFFYPADFSYVCPTELAKLSELYDDFHVTGTELLVISRDSVFVHKKRIEVAPELVNFKIKMVSDKEGEIGRNLGLINTHTGEYERATIICSPTGKVAYLQISNASIARNIEEFLRVVQGLNHLIRHPDKLCQENWQDGDAGVNVQQEKQHIFVH